MDEIKEFKAIHKNARISPAKLRPHADNIRFKECNQALAILRAMPQKSARLMYKVVHSALANAKLGDATTDNFFINVARIDGAPSKMKIWPRGRGRADRQLRRSSHIHIHVQGNKEN